MGTVWHRVDRLKPLYPLSAFHSVSVPFIKLVWRGTIFGGFAMAYESLFSGMGLGQLCWKEGVVEFKAWWEMSDEMARECERVSTCKT